MSFKTSLGKAFSFDSKEVFQFLISTVLGGFILSFRKWGTNTFDATEGVSNFILFTILFMVLYFIFIAAQKFLAAELGYNCKFETWYFGLVGALVLTFMTYGWVPFLFLGTVKLKEDMRLRLGSFRHYLNVKDMMYVGLAGPIGILLVLVLVVHPLYFISQNTFFLNVIYAATLILLFSSLPIPKTNGINVLLKSRYVWVTYFVLSLLFFLLLSQSKVQTYVAATIIALVIFIILRKNVFGKK